MKAIVVYPEHPHPRLTWEEVPDFSFNDNQVLVDVQATAVNRADLSQARGQYPPPPGESEILGLEMAGVIAAAGPLVTGWEVGDRVCALLAGGGYAEQVAVYPQMLLKLPDTWSFAQGAAIPEVWLTAFVNLFKEGQLEAGERVLLHAGASGVGTAAIQLAKAVEATVITTAGTPEKVQACRELGADVALNYRETDFLPAVHAATDNQGVDLILDPVGGTYLKSNLQALREGGRLVCIGLLGGREGAMDMGLVLGKSLKVIGSRLRPRSIEEKIRLTYAFRERFWPMLIQGQLRPIIDSTFPLSEAQSAHEYVRQNRNIGKVILIR
ncbi:MAG: NAD(P)H-quinone oxidoreductase [Chloroflexi bacterium]|nr:NAD(P)H-quinone oxidoreductase [Chloroflexota bacterium]MBP8058127.1 NAD(P)H-quinone oxidoreductase [Chloroflexota bacterium]